jgi:hypothetical protein
MNAGEQLIEQGQVKALRRGVADVLAARSLTLSELGRARIAACENVATLQMWLKRAVTAAGEAEVFAGDESR